MLVRHGVVIAAATAIAVATLQTLGTVAASAGIGVARSGLTAPGGLGRLDPPSVVNPPDGLGRLPLISAPGPSPTALGTNPATTTDNIFYGVSCPTSNFCMAVGETAGGPAPQTLTEEWNGNSWSIVSSPNHAEAQSNILYGVACTSASFCMAVGFYLTTGSDYLTLIEEWNGKSWSIVSSTDPAPGASDILAAVSCVSSSFCVAAGGYETASGGDRTLIESWNGKGSWTTATSENPSTTYDDLQGVSCTAIDLCWVVGQYESGPDGLSLTEKWDGTAWKTVGAPKAARDTTYVLQGVSCASASFCMAAGYDETTTSQRTLIDKWSGTSWTTVTSANPRSNTASPFLAGVSCASPTMCAAVGYYNNSSSSELTLVEMWNGKSWRSIKSTDPGGSTGSNYLTATSCPSSSFCMAAGFYGTASSYLLQTLAEDWNGTTWTTVS